MRNFHPQAGTPVQDRLSTSYLWFGWVIAALSTGLLVQWRYANHMSPDFDDNFTKLDPSSTYDSGDSIRFHTLSWFFLTPVVLSAQRQLSFSLLSTAITFTTLFQHYPAVAQAPSNIIDLNFTDSLTGTIFSNSGGYATVAYVPDINGDNLPEILIGARTAAPQNRFNAGSTYLIWGNLSLPKTIDLASWNTLNIGIRFDGANASDSSGIAVASSADINGDNIPEILIGAHYASPYNRGRAGSTYLIWGSTSLPKTVNLALWNNLNIGIRFDGAVAGDYSGKAVASSADINGDGIPEVLIGAHAAKPQGREFHDGISTGAGSTYLIWGNSSLPSTIDLASWNTLNIGIRFDGAEAGDYSGYAIASAADINGDNLAEIIIGAHGADPQSRGIYSSTGSTYLIWSNPSLPNIVDLALWNTLNIGTRFDGAVAGDNSGNVVASTLDINGDNIPEILIGAFSAKPQNRVNAGSTYLIWGNSSLPSTIDLASWNSLNLGIRFDGAVAGDYSGSAITSSADINGDNIPEILLGGYGAKPQNRTNAGTTYLIWGNSSLRNTVDLASWNTFNIGIRFDGTTSGENSGYIIASLPATDSMNKSGILIGTYNAGKTYLISGSGLKFNNSNTTNFTTGFTSTPILSSSETATTPLPVTTKTTTIISTTPSKYSSDSTISPVLTSANTSNTIEAPPSSDVTSIPPTAATLSAPIDEPSSPNYAGSIGGAIAGVAVVTALLAGIGIYACRKKRNSQKNNSEVDVNQDMHSDVAQKQPDSLDNYTSITPPKAIVPGSHYKNFADIVIHANAAHYNELLPSEVSNDVDNLATLSATKN